MMRVRIPSMARLCRLMSTTTAPPPPLPFRVLYGSHTGTAANYANTLTMFARMRNLEADAQPMTLKHLQGLTQQRDTPVAFVVATYGNGELPPASREAYEWLRQTRPNLQGVSYTIFGLGNSRYDEFNQAARAMDQLLRELGATPFHKVGFGDQQAAEGHQSSFQPWMAELWSRLGSSNVSLTLPVQYTVTPTQATAAAVGSAGLPVLRGFTPVEVVSNATLTPSGADSEVRLLQLNAKSSKLSYRAWDHLLVQPVIRPELAARFAKRLGLNLADRVQIEPTAAGARVGSSVVTVETVCRYLLDISAVPSRALLAGLAICAEDVKEREALEKISSDMGPNNQYTTLSTTGVWTLVDVLEQFPSVRLTLAQALTHCPVIQPRTYSICSNPGTSPDVVEVCYSVHSRHEQGKAFHGLASGHLQQAKAHESLFVQVTEGATPMPDIATPIVGVAMGTGIGMLRALILRRLQAHSQGQKVGTVQLFYGVRRRSQDFLFSQELEQAVQAGFLKLHATFSHDTDKFVTPLDKIDELRSEVGRALDAGATVLYCGLGGAVPQLVEAAIRQAAEACGHEDGWSFIAGLREKGRYLEEFYSRDADVENRMESLYGKAAALPMPQRFAKSEMFCFQCEQTFNNTGCTQTGVCGKTPDTAALQDLTVHACKLLGWYAHKLKQTVAQSGGRCSEAEFLGRSKVVGQALLYGMFSTLTNVNFDPSRFVKIVAELVELIEEQQTLYKRACAVVGKAEEHPHAVALPAKSELRADNLAELVMSGKVVGVLNQYERGKSEAAVGLNELLVYGLKGLCAYADHAKLGHFEDQSVYDYLSEALAFTLSPERFEVPAILQMCLRAGEANVKVLALLDTSNRQFGNPSPTKVPAVPTPGKCILISGHDLVAMSSLLKALEGTDIKVYTHGEMLPGHGYPSLRASKNLYGHFGGAWNRQSVEFPHFPGPIVMTTNCLTEPMPAYKERLFSFGAVGWPGVPHLGDVPETIDWQPVIQSALGAPGFGPNDRQFTIPPQPGITRPESYTVGFGHNAILENAGTILDQVQRGNITRFYVIGGCDGYEGSRSYFTDVAANMASTAVVLTLGCGKFRLNHLPLGEVADTGIPRVLDMGQCNDSFSGVEVAVALAQALKCNLNDLPLSFVISWFEQKAIACFLSLLHLGIKPIRLGPSLPAFINADVLDVLVKQFGVLPIGDPAEDVRAMESAKGMS